MTSDHDRSSDGKTARLLPESAVRRFFRLTGHYFGNSLEFGVGA